MTERSTSYRSRWAPFWLGLGFGAVVVALLCVAVVATSLLLDSSFLLILLTGFGSSVALTLLGLAGALLVALAVAGVLIWLLGRILPGLSSWRALGVRGAAAALVGGLLSSSLAVWLVPEPIKNTALQLVTGQTTAQRAARPAARAREQRLQAILGAQPGGPEAALLAAVDQVAEPVYAPGRQLTADDTNLRVEALRRLAPTLPPEWRPVLLGTLAEVQRGHSGSHPSDAPMRDTLVEAGRAGSRALMVLAAQEQEGIAGRHEAGGATVLADAAWQRALEGYAGAGAGFEVARLYDETLPERLRTLAVPAAARLPLPDAGFSQRLWQFSQALGDDAAYPHASPGQRELAFMSALIALERAPDAPQIAVRNPAQRWATDAWAMGRWVLAVRHARGDCLAALKLSDATRQRRRPAVVSRPQPPASSLDLAWALAWTEAGEACARTDDEHRQARERRANLNYLTFAPAELEAARAGVAASLAVLR